MFTSKSSDPQIHPPVKKYGYVIFTPMKNVQQSHRHGCVSPDKKSCRHTSAFKKPSSKKRSVGPDRYFGACRRILKNVEQKEHEKFRKFCRQIGTYTPSKILSNDPDAESLELIHRSMFGDGVGMDTIIV